MPAPIKPYKRCRICPGEGDCYRSTAGGRVRYYRCQRCRWTWKVVVHYSEPI